MESLPNFKMRIREQHAAAFELHHDMAVAFERAVLTPREHDGALALAVDMLMLHGYKAHGSVRLLAEGGHLEDAALLTNRLMEVAGACTALVSHEDRAVSERSAASYLARLWDDVSDVDREALPDVIRGRWDAIREQAGPVSTETAEDSHASDAVRHSTGAAEHARDEELLGKLVRGATAEQVLHASRPAVEARLAEHVGAVLAAASRSYLALAEQWNRVFGLIEKQTFESLAQRTRRWRSGH
jgi:hypothetical protein